MTLVDTDILIWYLRGNEKAKGLIEDLNEFSISVVTYIELLQGIRNKQEHAILKRTLRNWNARTVLINEDISARAMFLVEQYFLSSSFQLADALIAATAITNSALLVSGNRKHYKAIKNLQLKVFQPAH